MRIMEPGDPSRALILAGGKSSRFGRDKAFFPFGGKPLIEHIIAQLEPLFDEIIISANRPEAYMSLGCEVCPDILNGYGPLGGIHAGLSAAGGSFLFVTACDMPNVSAQLINQMRGIISSSPQAVVASRKGFIEPFHGFYSKQLIPLIEQVAAKGPCGIFSFLKLINPAVVECSDESPFFNINRPEDLA